MRLTRIALLSAGVTGCGAVPGCRSGWLRCIMCDTSRHPGTVLFWFASFFVAVSLFHFALISPIPGQIQNSSPKSNKKPVSAINWNGVAYFSFSSLQRSVRKRRSALRQADPAMPPSDGPDGNCEHHEEHGPQARDWGHFVVFISMDIYGSVVPGNTQSCCRDRSPEHRPAPRGKCV